MKKLLLAVAAFTLLAALPALADPCIVGPTGLFYVPSPKSVEQGHFGGGLYFDQYTLKREQNNNQTRSNLSGIYGVTDNMEVGFDKSFDSMDYSFDPGLTVNMKYVFPDSKVVKVATGAVIETDNNAYSSAYILAGAEVAYFGLGFNFGGHPNYPMNLSKFGAYNFEKRRPEIFYFLAGAEFDMKIAKMLIEYNSDAFAAGFRVPMQDGLNLNLGFRTESDGDRLHRETLGTSYDNKGWFAGVSGVF